MAGGVVCRWRRWPELQVLGRMHRKDARALSHARQGRLTATWWAPCLASSTSLAVVCRVSSCINIVQQTVLVVGLLAKGSILADGWWVAGGNAGNNTGICTLRTLQGDGGMGTKVPPHPAQLTCCHQLGTSHPAHYGRMLLTGYSRAPPVVCTLQGASGVSGDSRQPRGGDSRQALHVSHQWTRPEWP